MLRYAVQCEELRGDGRFRYMSTVSASTTALIVASISALVSLATAAGLEWSRRRAAGQHEKLRNELAKQREAEIEALRAENQTNLEAFKQGLAQRREDATEAARAKGVVAKYREPLLRSAFDFQSRIYNILDGGFGGRKDPEYFRLNTMFVLAEFLGWLEIIRQEVQFLDLGATAETAELGRLLDQVQSRLASTSRQQQDDYYLYRGEQRAIGELMLVKRDVNMAPGPRRECMGYASFVARQTDPDFARWFSRLGEAISRLSDQRPSRLIAVQHALIDLIDFLDSDRSRFPRGRRRIGDGPSGAT